MVKNNPKTLQPQLAIRTTDNAELIKMRTSEEMLEFIEEHSDIEKPVRQLLDLHLSHLEIKKQYEQELHLLDKRYSSRYDVLYNERSSIVNAHSSGKFGEQKASQGIPGFWLQVMKNNSLIAEDITEKDEDALKHLTNVGIKYLDRPGFRLDFEFEENEYFTNKILQKTFIYEEDEDDFSGDLVYGQTRGDRIFWKEGKSLIPPPLNGRGESRSTLIISGLSLFWFRQYLEPSCHVNTNYEPDGEDSVTLVSEESFFEFFRSPLDDDGKDNKTSGTDGKKDQESDEGGEDYSSDYKGDDEEEDDDDDILEYDFDRGEEFKEKLIPYALHWYTGEAALYESDEESDTESDVDGEGEDRDNEMSSED